MATLPACSPSVAQTPSALPTDRGSKPLDFITRPLGIREVWHIDIETAADTSLKTHGLPRYAADPLLQVQMITIERNLLRTGRPPEIMQYDLMRAPPLPASIREGLESPHVLKLAFNAPFEITVLAAALGITIDPERWLCVWALARTLSFSGGLGRVGEQLGLSEDQLKQAGGSRLIKMFSAPQRRTKRQPARFLSPADRPEAWEQYLIYNRQDVVAESEIFRRILPYLPYTFTEDEWRFYLLGQKINARGLPLDRAFIDNVLELYERYTERLLARARAITGLENPNSPLQLCAWLNSHGIYPENMQRGTLEGLLQASLPDNVRRAIEIRLELSKASISKYVAFRDRVSDDGLLRHCFLYFGASRTGRESSTGVQIHNLPGANLDGVESVADLQREVPVLRRTVATGDPALLDIMYGSVAQALSAGVRSVITAPEGYLLCVADYSSIESVVIGWLSGCERILNLYREGKDAYKDFATEVYSIPYDAVDRQQRKFCKPAVLGCCYSLGGFGLANYAHGFGVDLAEQFRPEFVGLAAARDDGTVPTLDTLTLDEMRVTTAQHFVNVYRAHYPEVVSFWYDLRDAWMQAVDDRATVSAGPVTYIYHEPYLFCRLPSGRHLAYYQPEINVEDTPWGRRPVMSYMGLHQKTRRWMRIGTHHGKLAENITQAVARDILRQGLLNADARGLDTRGHIHDEVVTLVEASARPAVHQRQLQTLIDCMTDLPAWAAGMPISATGYVSKYFMKD